MKRRLDFSEAVAGFRTSPAYITNHDERALFLKDNLLCIPQDYKSDVDEKQSSTYIAIDLENGKVTPYSIPFPDWVLEKSQGKTVEILCEDYDEKKGLYLGRDEFGRMGYFQAEKNAIGEFVNLKITKANGISLYGEIVEK